MSGGAYRQRGLVVLRSIPSRSSVPVPARQHRTAFPSYPEPVPAVLGLPLRARLAPLSVRTCVFLSSRPLIQRASRAQGRHEENISASQQFCWMPPGTNAFRKLARVARKLSASLLKNSNTSSLPPALASFTPLASAQKKAGALANADGRTVENKINARLNSFSSVPTSLHFGPTDAQW